MLGVCVRACDVPLTVMVTWSRGHSLKSHPTDWILPSGFSEKSEGIQYSANHGVWSATQFHPVLRKRYLVCPTLTVLYQF